MSFVRGVPLDLREQVMGTNGRLACRWCRQDITERRRISYCSDQCRHEYRLRNENEYARACVFARDRGICAQCKKDTVAEATARFPGRGQLPLDLGGSRWMPVNRRFLRWATWEMDHVLEVADGGGSAGLDNLQTLCPTCHARKTAAFAAERARRRRGGLAPGAASPSSSSRWSSPSAPSRDWMREGFVAGCGPAYVNIFVSRSGPPAPTDPSPPSPALPGGEPAWTSSPPSSAPCDPFPTDDS